MTEKIAVIINFNKKDWLGGYNYFKNFFRKDKEMVFPLNFLKNLEQFSD
jgi:hypothetical protein